MYITIDLTIRNQGRILYNKSLFNSSLLDSGILDSSNIEWIKNLTKENSFYKLSSLLIRINKSIIKVILLLVPEFS